MRAKSDKTGDAGLAQGARAVSRAAGVPLWRQVQEDLVRRVHADEFADEFPGELALVDQYGVSRHTVREALRSMRQDGIVSGERGRTSRLTEPAEIDQPLGSLYSLFAAVEGAGQRQRSIVRMRDVRADGVVARRLSLEESTPLLYLERLRLASERPLALDRVWLPASLALPLLDVDFTETGLYDELRNRCGLRLSGGQEHLRAVVPTPSERLVLDMPDDVAVLAIERLAFNGVQPVEWRHTLVRGDRFAVSAEFSGRKGYQLTGGSDDAR